MLEYDESAIVVRLDRIVPQLRCAFAAACAERIRPAFDLYVDRADLEKTDVLEVALDVSWKALKDQRFVRSEVESLLEKCMDLLPHEDEGIWSVERASGEDAVAAVAYTLRSLLTEQSQEAAWSARRVFEALEYYVRRELDAKQNGSAKEQEILKNEIIQEELRNQAHDLSVLESISNREAVFTDRIEELRKQAKARIGAPFSS